jgi:hypothetical protein
MEDPHPAVHLEKPGEDVGPHQNFSGTDVVEEGMEQPHFSGFGIEEGESDDTLDQAKEAEEEEEEDNGALFSSEIREMIDKGLMLGFALLLAAYLLAAFIIDFQRAIALFIITVVCIAWNIYAYWAKMNEETVVAAEDKVLTFFEKTDSDWKYGGGTASLLILIMAIIMAVTVRDGRNMVSLFGLLVFLGLTWMFSWKPKKVKFRPVVGGIFIQFIFGYVVIRTSWGFAAIEFLADVFTTLLSYTVAGSSFVFDWLTDGSLYGTPFQLVNGESYTLGPPFFFSVLPSVIFFSALMSVGYYLRILPWLVRKLGKLPPMKDFFHFSFSLIHTVPRVSLPALERIRFGDNARHIGVGVPLGCRKYLCWSDRGTFACSGKRTNAIIYILCSSLSHA